MAQHAAHPPDLIVDLDSPENRLVPWAAPVVVDGEVVTVPLTVMGSGALRPPYVSPLAADKDGTYPTALRGGTVTDPRAVERIRQQIEYGELHPLRRLVTPAPEGWRR